MPSTEQSAKLDDNTQSEEDTKTVETVQKNDTTKPDTIKPSTTTDDETKEAISDKKESEQEETKEPSIKPSKESTDSDSDDGESEEDKAKEEEERKKLQQETEQHKQKMLKYFFIAVSIEFLVCSVLLSPPDAVLNNEENNYLTSRIYNFRGDTMDVIFASIFRLLALYGFVYIATTWGDSKSYDPNKEKHTIFNTEASHYKLITKIRGSAAYIILQIWQNIIGLNRYASVNNDANFNSLLYSQNDGNKTNINNETDKKKKMKKLFDLKEFVNKYAGMDAQDVADVWKTVIWMMLFLTMTVCTTIIGVKIAFWRSDDINYKYNIFLFVFIIILTHLQSFIIKKYIDDCCKPSNRYLNIKIHPHPMFKTLNRGRYCQLCWQRPGQHSTERKLIFKCLQCPQHRAFVCVKCWNKKKKQLKKMEEDKKEKENEIFIDNDRDVTYYEYFSTLLKYHLPYIHLLLLGVIFMGIQTIISIFLPSQKGQVLDVLISGDISGFYAAIKMQMFLTVMNGIISSISSQSMNRVSQQITCDLQKRMFSNLMAQDMVFFDNHTTAEINERMNWGLSEMLSPFQGTIRTSFSIISLFGSLWMCLNISWRLTFLGLSTLGPMSYFMGLFARWNWQRNLVQQQLQREMYSISYQGFEHIRSVRAFAKEHEFVRYYSMLRQESHDTDNKKQFTQSINGIINGWFQLGTKLLLTYIAGMIILFNDYSTTLTVGAYVTFETYWNKLYHTMRSIKGMYGTYDHALFMAKKILRTLEKRPNIEHLAICDNDTEDDKKSKELIKKIDGNIKFENVEFYYESSPDKLVLKSIDLEIEKGKTIALVGRSGGGKSTIMHLILRFYDPTKGKITINGINLKKYNPYSLRRQIALVSQDTELFTKSVEYNIGFGANKLLNIYNNDNDNEYYESSYNLGEVEYCSKLANAHKFISDMEDKYDTQMGTRAKRCSGGQKQRISIARMLMSKPNVMLLDEATSSLDAESEALVQAAMEKESQENDCTLIIVAHRLSTVVNADKICVVDDGCIVEQGTHEELIEINGIYASLVERQINLRTKMKEKLKKIHDGTDNGQDGDGDDDDDFDNIDKLIDQIKAEKAEKENLKKKEENNKNNNDVIEEEIKA